MHFKTNYNMSGDDQTKPRKIFGISKTLPDQTMDLKTILDRYARGLPITGNSQQPIYEGEEGFAIDPRTLDLSELHNMAKTASEAIREAEMEQMEKDKAARKEAFKKALKAELEEELKKEAEKAS